MTSGDESEIDVTNEANELKVTFYPPLVLQRRIWILDILRTEQVTEVLDVGCGEGQLLSVLCQPAPWLASPPSDILEEDPTPFKEKIPNLHPTRLFGLDICSDDLAFAVQGTAPPVVPESPSDWSYMSTLDLRWEPLLVKLWRGGLELVNEEFIDVQCIVSTEVIEHLPPNVLPAFAPMLLGVYHPELVLITTPSYTFNVRFTSPKAPASARQGFPDPTGRTDRIFRHPDHKFEWTTGEFEEWCNGVAREWGYEVQISSVGRAQETDPWGRDEELGGATQVALFKRLEMEEREVKGREEIRLLGIQAEGHNLLVQHEHTAQSSARNPQALEEIASCVRETMEELREEMMRIEQLWFERNLAEACGGWIELLIAAVDRCEYLELKRDAEEMQGERGSWLVELIGGFSKSRERAPLERAGSSEPVLRHWFPEEDCVQLSDEEDNEYTDVEGDVSRDASDMEDAQAAGNWSEVGWGNSEGGWCGAEARVQEGWSNLDIPNDSRLDGGAKCSKIIRSLTGSTTGWEGDESEDIN